MNEILETIIIPSQIAEHFHKGLNETIKETQNEYLNQAVQFDIRYSTSYSDSGYHFYSAIIIVYK